MMVGSNDGSGDVLMEVGMNVGSGESSSSSIEEDGPSVGTSVILSESSSSSVRIVLVLGEELTEGILVMLLTLSDTVGKKVCVGWVEIVGEVVGSSDVDGADDSVGDAEGRND